MNILYLGYNCYYFSFGTAGDYSRHSGLTPQATIVDNVPSALVSTKIDIYCMLVKLTSFAC